MYVVNSLGTKDGLAHVLVSKFVLEVASVNFMIMFSKGSKLYLNSICWYMFFTGVDMHVHLFKHHDEIVRASRRIMLSKICAVTVIM